jgi:small neutral amino acid transporter SnatA (MarC family)
MPNSINSDILYCIFIFYSSFHKTIAITKCKFEESAFFINITKQMILKRSTFIYYMAVYYLTIYLLILWFLGPSLSNIFLIEVPFE